MTEFTNFIYYFVLTCQINDTIKWNKSIKALPDQSNLHASCNKYKACFQEIFPNRFELHTRFTTDCPTSNYHKISNCIRTVKFTIVLYIARILLIKIFQDKYEFAKAGDSYCNILLFVFQNYSYMELS